MVTPVISDALFLPGWPGISQQVVSFPLVSIDTQEVIPTGLETSRFCERGV